MNFRERDDMGANVIMVASGKGGTGKSTVAVLLGAELAARGRRVLLVELDSGLRSVDYIAGVYGKTVYDVEDVLNGRCEAGKAVVESPVYRNLYVISAPYSGGHILPAALRVFVEKVGPVFDTIVLDTAAGMGVPFEAAMGVAHRALLVLTPDPVSIRDGRIVCDALEAGGCRKYVLSSTRYRARWQTAAYKAWTNASTPWAHSSSGWCRSAPKYKKRARQARRWLRRAGPVWRCAPLPHACADNIRRS